MSTVALLGLPPSQQVWSASRCATDVRQLIGDRLDEAWRPSDAGVRTQPMSVRRRSTQLCGERPGERDAPPHGRALLDCVEKVVPEPKNG